MRDSSTARICGGEEAGSRPLGSLLFRAILGPLACVLLVACERVGDPASPGPEASPRFSTSPAAVVTRMKGSGSLGTGDTLASGGRRQQTFEFDVDADLNGSLDYVDYGVIRASGAYGELHAGPTWPGTAILGFTQTSSACVEFNGVGWVNTDEHVHFGIEACDNGSPGTGLDVFGIAMPLRPYFRGPDALADGEITRSAAGGQTIVIQDMRGAGAIGDGGATGSGGLDRQVFEMEVGVENGVVAGSLEYTDSAALEADGLPARFVVGPDEPGTAIVEWTQISDACVELEGVGRLVNAGELVSFEVRACDAADAGTHLDVFGLRIPERSYAKGPDTLSDGDLTATAVLR